MISVIMPSFLDPYAGSASNRERKFIRSVDSFLKNGYIDKELLIVSDGDKKTSKLYKDNYSDRYNVRLIEIEKQPLFSGNVRQAGIDASIGDVVAFLDSDDYLSMTHLGAIAMGFKEYEYDWVYYNDYIFNNSKRFALRNVTLAHGTAGTSCIAYKKSLSVDWKGCDGYGHDWLFIKKLMEKSNNFGKIYGCGYHVCHLRGIGEC